MRLVTRGDLDGVSSAVLLTTVEPVDAIELIHPQDITDGRFEVLPDDIMANLPYHPAAALWFDHHELTGRNRRPPEKFRGRHRLAPSAARVIYEHYSSPLLLPFAGLVDETDRFDSAHLSREEVLNPQGAVLLGFTVDSRTGLGQFKEYFLHLVDWLKRLSIPDVLRQGEVQRRVAFMRENDLHSLQALREHSRREGNVVVTDLRSLDQPPVGNRFLVYTLFPDTNVSLRLQWGPGRTTVAATIGHNIFNRTSRSDCGLICGDFGGGGHRGAAACLLDAATADEQAARIIARLRQDG